MLQKFKQIWIYEEDDLKLMNECRKLFLQSHKELAGMPLSRAFIFKKVIDYYLK